MSMAKVLIVGGGFAGCAAALSAKKAGAESILLERTDMLLGNGLECGVINGNGNLTAMEEAKAMGGGDLFDALESIILYKGVPFGRPGEYIYNVDLSEPVIRRLLEKSGVAIQFRSRAIGVEKKRKNLLAVVAEKRYDYTKEKIHADAFVDTSGTGGGMTVCKKYGKGCMMCMLRCPTFGDRVSIATEAGAEELVCNRPDGTPGRLSSAICISKDGVAPEIRAKVEEKGTFPLPLPTQMIDPSKHEVLTNPNLPKEHIENLYICNVGSRYKLLGQPYFPLEEMRKVPGLENARVINWGSSDYNAVRYVSMAPRDPTLLVKGFANLFCAGEKSGPVMSIVQAIVTGLLAGHNAARVAFGLDPIAISRKTVVGDFTAYVSEVMVKKGGLDYGGYSPQGGPYFERMKEIGLYTTDIPAIKTRIDELGLTGIFGKRVA